MVEYMGFRSEQVSQIKSVKGQLVLCVLNWFEALRAHTLAILNRLVQGWTDEGDVSTYYGRVETMLSLQRLTTFKTGRDTTGNASRPDSSNLEHKLLT